MAQITDVVRGANLQADDFNIGTDVANAITINVDGTTVVRGPGGLSSPVTVLDYDSATTTLTYTDENGNDTVVDLSALTTDLYITSAAFDPATAVLTLIDADTGTPDVTVNLGALLGVSGDANNILTNGASDGKPFLDCPTIVASCGDTCDVVDVFNNTFATFTALA